MSNDHNDAVVSNRISKALRDLRQRMVRVESRVTSFMRYHGFRPGRDLQTERVGRVFVDHERGEIHVTSPDVEVGLILDGAIEAGADNLTLFVSGIECGTIEPSQPIGEEAQ
jgi:hypothetical protein